MNPTRSIVAYLILIFLPFLFGSRSVYAFAPSLARFPNSSATRIVFVARNELWSIARTGGEARQLTREGGRKLMPRFSPDGQWLAFTARHNGRQDVYVMGADGGTPKRLTWFPNSGAQLDELVVTWTPDSSAVIFGSRRLAAHYSDYRLFQVPREGGAATALPPTEAGLASFDGDGHTLYFADGLHDFEPRRDYHGGQQQAIFSLDLKTNKVRRLTGPQENDSDPMPDGGDLYFVSDRDPSHRENLWALDLHTSALRQVTHYTDGSIDFPSIGAGAITFQRGGRLVMFEVAGQTLHDVNIDIPQDESARRARPLDVSKWRRDTDNAGRSDVALSPSGTSAVFSARGHLFEVDPTRAKEIVGEPGADADHPAWSPDGQVLAYTSDIGTEQFLMLRSRDGKLIRLPRFGSGFVYASAWSPDGKALLVPDAGGNLWLVNLAGGSVLVGRDPTGAIVDASFSPDGRWIAYSTDRENQHRAIHLYEISSKVDHVVSSLFDSDRMPRFSPDGRHLAFVSKRYEFTVESQSEHNFASILAEGLYIVSLSHAAEGPQDGQRARPESAASVRVDLAGLMDRVKPIPVDAGEYTGLDFVDGAIVYARRVGHWTGGSLPGLQSSIFRFSLSDQKESRVVDDAENFVVAANGDRILFQTSSGWDLSGLKVGDAAEKLKTSPLLTTVDEHSEWRQIFEFAWRMDRDSFADDRVSGDRWKAVHDAYVRLLPQLGSREDLTWLVRQMQGELASSHTFVEAVDVEDSGPRTPVALLGADLAFDPFAKVFRVMHVYRGDNSRPEFRSPLTEAEVDVESGDALLKVNGLELPLDVDPYRAFSGIGADVTLTVQSESTHVIREVVVHPVRSERALRWNDFVLRSREQVERLSKGQVAYVCMEDLHSDGLQQFIRQFYPQERKPSFLFDMRWNQGGYESQPVLERLRRTRVGFIKNRQGAVMPIPEQAIAPDMATLIGRYTISDGEQFAYFFRSAGLGELVGERTAGNVMGVGAPWDLIDGGILAIPADKVFSLDGRRLIEGSGVTASLEAASDPADATHDGPLEAAVKALTSNLHHASSTQH